MRRWGDSERHLFYRSQRRHVGGKLCLQSTVINYTYARKLLRVELHTSRHAQSANILGITIFTDSRTLTYSFDNIMCRLYSRHGCTLWQWYQWPLYTSCVTVDGFV